MGPARILFFTWYWSLIRFEDVLAKLLDSGHEIVIATPATRSKNLPRSLRSSPRVGQLVYKEYSNPSAARAMTLLRDARSYVWRLGPALDRATFSRRHSLEHLVASATAGIRKADPSWPDPALPLEREEQEAIGAALAELERRIPPEPEMVELIRSQRPDVVLVSPLVNQRSQQTEALKAARALGVPTAFLPRSWDNLSNRGRIHVPPDRAFVWNEVQRREAIELHGLHPSSVIVTGAPHFDRFFARRSELSRAEFCRLHDFDESAPIVMFLGSSMRICPDEATVLGQWLEAFRGSASERLRGANVLYRPHPERPDPRIPTGPWSNRGNASISLKPREGDQELYEQLFHADAAVGLNTTAQVEASILGTPVYTYSAGDLAPGQDRTLHYDYLLKQHGGAVTHSDSLAGHVRDLEGAVAGDYDREAIRRFSEAFIRPRGLDKAVSPIVADEVLELADTGRVGHLEQWRAARRRVQAGPAVERRE
jgi:hypothetical protein